MCFTDKRLTNKSFTDGEPGGPRTRHLQAVTFRAALVLTTMMLAVATAPLWLAKRRIQAGPYAFSAQVTSQQVAEDGVSSDTRWGREFRILTVGHWHWVVSRESAGSSSFSRHLFYDLGYRHADDVYDMGPEARGRPIHAVKPASHE
jgi:hypothetical protein